VDLHQRDRRSEAKLPEITAVMCGVALFGAGLSLGGLRALCPESGFRVLGRNDTNDLSMSLGRHRCALDVVDISPQAGTSIMPVLQAALVSPRADRFDVV
jgi:hypothetical protein